MSIEEMIETMLANETEDGTWVDTTMARQIIAALRAGQDMRDSFEPIDDDDGTSWAVDIKRGDLSVAG